MKKHTLKESAVQALRELFGSTVRVELDDDVGLVIRATKAQAIKSLRELFGPTARFEERMEHGVPVTRAVVGQGASARVLVQKAGPPDWAALLVEALPALASSRRAARAQG